MPYKDIETRRAQGRLATRRYRAKRQTNPEPFRQRERERYRRRKTDPEQNAKLLAANRRRKARRMEARRTLQVPTPPRPADLPLRPPSPTAAKKHAYYLANQERIKAMARAWRAAHPEQSRQRTTAWRQTHPARTYAHNERRRAQKYRSQHITLSAEEWEAILMAFDHRCAYCPYYKPDCPSCRTRTHKLTKDHLTPLAHGGDHTRHNIVPACASCNAKKGQGPPPGPVQPLLI
jgi:hypothetical protein